MIIRDFKCLPQTASVFVVVDDFDLTIWPFEHIRLVCPISVIESAVTKECVGSKPLPVWVIRR